jgi:hypothetical protein
MKKLLALVVSLLILIILITGTSNSFMKLYKEARSNSTVWGSQRLIYTDLYNLSHLKDFKYLKDSNTVFHAIPQQNLKKNNLYYLCDSYLYLFVEKDSVERNFRSSHQGIWDRQNLIYNQLDTSSLNVLLIERVERYVYTLKDTAVIINKINPSPKDTTSQKNQNVLYSFFETIEKKIYNKRIESNLELLFFDYKFFNKLKEYKSSINYFIFNRTDKDVCISSDKKYLFYRETVEKNNPCSSFRPIRRSELDSIVISLNYLSKKYKREGFDEVYFSFPPNPATLFEHGMDNYNNLLPDITNHTGLEAKVIDVYQDFKHNKSQTYYFSDTHWNYTGFNIWLDKFYKELDSLCIRNPQK